MDDGAINLALVKARKGKLRVGLGLIQGEQTQVTGLPTSTLS